MKRIFRKAVDTQLHTAFAATVILLIASLAGCQQKGSMPRSEMEEFTHYRNAIEQAQDSGNYEKMLALCKEFYEVSQKGHSDLFRAYASSDYGQELILLDDPDKGKQLLDEALQLAYEYEEDTVMLEIYNGLGLYEHATNKNYYAAGEYYLKSLEYARRCDKEKLFGVLCNIGAVFNAVDDTTGLKYIEEAYHIAEETNNPTDRMNVAHRMIYQMDLRGNDEEMLKWQNVYMENLPQPRRVVSENKVKAQIAFRQKDYARAKQHIDIATATADTTKNIQISEKTYVVGLKAAILHELGRYEESNKWLEKCEGLEQNANNKKRQDIVRLYAKNYEKMGNYAKAVEYQKLLSGYLEEEANTERIHIFKAKEVAHDVAQKDEEIKLQKQKARLYLWMNVGALLACVLLAALCIYLYLLFNTQRRLTKVVVERAKAYEEKEEEKKKQVDQRYLKLFEDIKQKLEDNQLFKDQNLSRDYLAELLGTNRTYISEAVKMVTGMTVPQYVNYLRCCEAERKLLDKDATVSNLATLGKELGFVSLSAFQVAFKRHTGMTLSAYRKIAGKEMEG